MNMERNDEYHKNCPNCGNEFKANHLSRIYCCETCKRHMFRKKKQDKRKLKSKDQEALESNDLRLDELYTKSKPSYSKADLEEAKLNPKCYDRRFKIENYINNCCVFNYFIRTFHLWIFCKGCSKSAL